MPQSRAKPSELAAEAKRHYLPHIAQRLPQFPARSICYPDITYLQSRQVSRRASTATVSSNGLQRKLRLAVIEGDPIDVALDWHDSNCAEAGIGSSSQSDIAGSTIPVINPANEKRPGGDWESGLMAPEECLCRRSTLSAALVTPMPYSQAEHYPIGTCGGIYSPSVVVFRSGPMQNNTVWQEFRALPIISVSPVRRPKLDEDGQDYSFSQEKELMKEKMRVVLRIAMFHGHLDLCMGAFGVGYGFRNPAVHIAKMWHDILYSEMEFRGAFDNIVFAIDDLTNNISGNSSASNNPDGLSDIDVFRREFAPDNIIKTKYRQSRGAG